MDGEPLRVLLRCDAGPEIGGGHVMRCLTLADSLRGAGATCVFACSAATAQTVPQVQESGFEVLWLSDPLDPVELESLCLDRFTGRASIIVVDHYRLDAAQEQAFRRFAPVVAIIDDLANRPHDCDLLLDQTFGRSPADHVGLVPAHASVLGGADFALLRPTFAELREGSLARRRDDPAIRRLLVALGMTDIGGTTKKVVQAIHGSADGVEIDVAVGANIPDLEALHALAAQLENVHLHVATSHMAELMCQADVAIGAGGTSTWERCCLGLPTIMLTLADNQRLIASRLDELGAAETIDLDNLDYIPVRLAFLRDDPERLLRMGQIAASVTDGRGAEKVASALLEAAASSPPRRDRPLTVRRAEARDRVDVWLWRNHETARRFSADTVEIPFCGHARWWGRNQQDAQTVLLILEADGRSVGQVRFDIDRAEAGGHASAIVSIALAPAFQGMGYGASCLSEAIVFYHGKLNNAGPLFADIRPDNLASVRIFERCGFEWSGQSGEFNRYRRDEPRSAEAKVMDE